MHCTDDELEESTQNNSEDNDNSTTEEANVKGARVCLNLYLNNLNF